MKEIVNGLKLLLGDEVKDLYRYNQIELNLMLFKPEDLDVVYALTENYVLQIAAPDTLARINFINDKEEVLKSLSLVQ
ncbi:hypothetical protein [Pedobacter aquatilis]|uniref:hypothetical protein n=1 Tax=Pedobacter aquatilis TaxID=351343 RepID=UPI00292D42F6|nr:hypothetical protein [Pedobacter aquatilis]